MDTAMEYYKDRLSLTDIPLGVGDVTKGISGSQGLKYPGKVHFNEETDLLFVADSSNHRILSVEQKTGIYYKIIWLLFLVFMLLTHSQELSGVCMAVV